MKYSISQMRSAPGRPYITVTPSQLYGIEINEYAYELAQMTIQIGYIQWLRDNGYGFPNEPILQKVRNIVQMDAILTAPSRLPQIRQLIL